MMMQNTGSSTSSTQHGSGSNRQPLMQTPRPLSTAEFNRLVAKRHQGQELTAQEKALMKAQHDWNAQQFLAALKAGVREGIETP